MAGSVCVVLQRTLKHEQHLDLADVHSMLRLTHRSIDISCQLQSSGSCFLLLAFCTPNHLPGARFSPRLPVIPPIKISRNYALFSAHISASPLLPWPWSPFPSQSPGYKSPHRNLASTVEPSGNTSSPAFPRQASSAFYPYAPSFETPFPASRVKVTL